MLVGTSLKPKSAVAAGEDFQGEVAIIVIRHGIRTPHMG